MNNSVLIKGSKDGLTISVREAVRYDELLEVLKTKFSGSRNFFKNASIALAIEGIELTENQEREIVDLIEEYSDMKICCLVDDREVRNARFYQAIRDKEYIRQTQTGQFIKGTLRKGQVFETAKSVIVLGNVDKGARIVSNGNIIIMGELNGFACAGAGSETPCFVAAFHMNPRFIRINHKTAKCPDRFRFIRNRGPKIAYLDRGNICIDNIAAGTRSHITI